MKSKGVPNEKVAELENDLKSCHGRLDGFGKELQNLLTEINTISDWIYTRFGVSLNPKSSFLSDNIRNCEEWTEFNDLGNKNSSTEINLTASVSNKTTKQSPQICSSIKIDNVDSMLSPEDMNGDSDSGSDREATTLKKRRGRPKKASGQSFSPTVRITDTSTSTTNQVVPAPKRGRPKKDKQVSNIQHTAVETPNSKCETCGKLLKDAGSLRQHQLIHKNGKPYPCPECGKCFGRKFHLKTHRLIHAGVKKHQCGYCGKLFLLPKDLIYHERTHTGEKPFSCTVCPKSFILKSHLVMHLRIHTGEKPYRCEVCEKCFSQSNSLRIHKKVHQKPRNSSTKNSLARQLKRHAKQEISPTPIIYSVPNSGPRPRQMKHPNNPINIEVDPILTPSQGSLPLSDNIPVTNLVTFDIVPISVPVTQHQHETHNPIRQNMKIESNNLTVQDVFQLQPEISNTVEIINLNHVNIEQIIRDENVDNRQSEEQVNQNIVQETTYIGNDVNESYFY